ncbi:MAG TPA: S16 family serine protease [Ilumatobacteraceae bacterium]|nr:S16 family serine protease [Ilumatobacteraceae bacterium]
MTDTTTDSVPSVDGPTAPRAKWWAWAMAGVGLFVLAVIGVASLLPATLVSEKENQRTGDLEPTPYALTPASADPVNDRIVFGELPAGVERFEAANDFHFVTVTSPTQSVLSWFAGRDEPAIDFLTEEDKFGVRTPSQRREFNLQMMRTAEQEAQYVALTTLGYDVEITPGEVIVQDVLCKTPGDEGECAEWFPSDEQIDPADRILEAEGVALESVEDLSAVLADREPGDTIDLRIDRPGEGESDVTVELSASPDDPERTIIGFIPFDTRAITLPFEVDIRTDDIGGPSAGLAFTLAMIDELSPGDLTGPQNVAVTGTIALDGSVGAIGGLTQKVSAVQQNGMRVFLVPASQSELDDPERMQRLIDAGRGEVEIIPVATLDEALAALEELGGDPLVPVA